MKILPIDENRIIIKQASLDNITGKWKDAVDIIVEKYKEIFGDKLVSVYINGSVATGDAVEHKSDIDTNAIVDMTDEEIETLEHTTLPHEIVQLNTTIPFVRKVEVHIHSKDTWSERKRFQMKITGVCVYGKNYDNETPAYTLSRETFQKFRVSIPKDIQKARDELSLSTSTDDVRRTATWIAKRLIRNAGTMALWKGDFYTMDVSLMAEVFAKSYPEKKDKIEILLDWITNPPENKTVVIDFLDTFGSWLIDEDMRVFG